MKRLLIITLTVIGTINAALWKAPSDSVPSAIPAYESVDLLKNYRVNQGIKGFYRWASVGAAAGALFYLNNPDDLGIGLILYPPLGGFLGGVTGGIVGVHKGEKFNQRKRRNPNFHAPKNLYGYEVRFGTSLSDSKFSSAIFISGRNKWSFIDGWRIGYCYNEWDGDWVERPDGHYSYNAEEIKYEIHGVKYFTRRLIKPYIGLGIGLSRGRNRFFQSAGNDNDSKTDRFSGFFFRPFFGVNINAWDFYYTKIEMSSEYSTFYREINNLNDYPVEDNFVIAISFGAYIF